MIPSDDLATWLQQNALTVVPVAAAELLDRAIDHRLELDRMRHLLREAGRREGDTALTDLLLIKQHQLDLLTDRLEAAEAVIDRVTRGGKAENEISAWRRAKAQHLRSPAA